MPQKVKVLLVDDHPLLRQGLAVALAQNEACNVVGEAGDGLEACRMIMTLKPDVAILDLDLPGLDGFGVARKVLQNGLATKVIILTMHNKPSLIDEAMELGVDGFILKDNAIQDILAGVRAVAQGQSFFSPAITEILARRYAKTKLDSARGSISQSLTKAEKQILRRIAVNKTSKEIAAELGVSFFTIETHRKNICAKLDLRGPHALLNYALQHPDLTVVDDSQPSQARP